MMTKDDQKLAKKDSCVTCGISETEYYKKHGKPNIYFNKESAWKSFHTLHDGTLMCGHCHKEKGLESLFSVLNNIK